MNTQHFSGNSIVPSTPMDASSAQANGTISDDVYSIKQRTTSYGLNEPNRKTNTLYVSGNFGGSILRNIVDSNDDVARN